MSQALKFLLAIIVLMPSLFPAPIPAAQENDDSDKRHFPGEMLGIRMAIPWVFDLHDPASIVENCKSAHINTILATVNSSALEHPKIEELIRLAHEQGIAFHAVISTLNAYGHAIPGEGPNPDYHAVDSMGEMDEKWLDPCKPAVRELVMATVRGLCEYDIDGLQLDYIRFGNPEMGHSEQARAAWKSWSAENPEKNWEQWRDSVILDYVWESKNIVREKRPKALFSVSTWTVGPGWDRKTLLTEWGEGYGWEQGQDFDLLVEEVDYIRPMLYSCMFHKPTAWAGKLAAIGVRNANGMAQLVMGAAFAVGSRDKKDGTWINAEELRETIRAMREARADGIVFYHYDHLFNPKVAPDYEEFDYAAILRELFPPVAGNSALSR